MDLPILLKGFRQVATVWLTLILDPVLRMSDAFRENTFRHTSLLISEESLGNFHVLVNALVNINRGAGGEAQ